MKKTVLQLILLIFILSFSQKTIISQESTIALPEYYKRNVIKWNVTSFLIWSNRNINFSYERILSPHHSFSVNAGYFELPSLGVYDSLNITNTVDKFGFSVSGDYRYYFKNRNKNFAPDGLFWGIYSSYHHYQFSNDIEVLNSPTVQGNLLLKGNLDILSLGVELGYQFVIKERFTIDLIFMGPSLSMYKTNLTLDGNLTVDGQEEYLKAIYDMMVSKYPFIDELVQTGGTESSGANTSFGFGLRYLIQLGYRF